MATGQDIIVKRIPALPVGANASAGYKIAVWNETTNTTQQFDVSEFLNEVQSGNYDWVVSTTYAINEVVFYDNKLWASLQNGNVGQTPQAGAWWVEVVKGASSGLKNWAAGAYTADEVFVVYDPGAGNNLYELVNITRPYYSTDIDAEIILGDWEPFNLSSSDLVYDSNRAIKALPAIGQNANKTSILDFVDEIYFPDQAQLISISPQPVIEVGVSHAPNIVGTIVPNDSVISARRVREVIGDTVEANPATDAVNESLTAITMVLGVNKTYRIEADSDLATDVHSLNKDLVGAYPYLFGAGTAGLTGNALYAAIGIGDIVSVQEDKTLNFNFSNLKMYLCYPEEYPDLTSIIDPNGFEILGATFSATPVIASVISDSLFLDWTHNYKIYESISNISANGDFEFYH